MLLCLDLQQGFGLHAGRFWLHQTRISDLAVRIRTSRLTVWRRESMSGVKVAAANLGDWG